MNKKVEVKVQEIIIDFNVEVVVKNNLCIHYHGLL